jgi:hypothetical protein
MIRYDEHARFQVERWKIVDASVEVTLSPPDATELKGHRRSFLNAWSCFL